MSAQARQDLLDALHELSALNPEMRYGQWIANLAPSALDGAVEAIWDVEDKELLAEAQQPLQYYRSTRPERAAAYVSGRHGQEALISPPRRELLRVIQQLACCCDWRIGQLLANLATAARFETDRGGFPEAVYDVEDEDLLPAARKLLEYFRTTRPGRVAEYAAAAN